MNEQELNKMVKLDYDNDLIMIAFKNITCFLHLKKKLSDKDFDLIKDKLINNIFALRIGFDD
jgi:glutaredoxin-related protein